jgi:uncharacterized protein (TIGR03067 family)
VFLTLLSTFSFAQEGGKQSAEEVGKQELAKLQGQWVLERGGGGALVYTFKGNEYTIGDSNSKVTFTIDAATEPKSITRTTSKGEVSRGIYKVDGDTLMICSAQGGREKPTEFVHKAGDWTLLTFKRVKN